MCVLSISLPGTRSDMAYFEGGGDEKGEGEDTGHTLLLRRPSVESIGSSSVLREERPQKISEGQVPKNIIMEIPLKVKASTAENIFLRHLKYNTCSAALPLHENHLNIYVMLLYQSIYFYRVWGSGRFFEWCILPGEGLFQMGLTLSSFMKPFKHWRWTKHIIY